jgi:hypothetical protein
MFVLELQGASSDYYLTERDRAKMKSPIFLSQIDEVMKIFEMNGCIFGGEKLLDSVLAFGILNDIIPPLKEEIRHRIRLRRKLNKTNVHGVTGCMLLIKEWIEKYASTLLSNEKMRLFYFVGGTSPKNWFSNPFFDKGVTLMVPNEKECYFSINYKVDLSEIHTDMFTVEQLKSIIR